MAKRIQNRIKKRHTIYEMEAHLTFEEARPRVLEEVPLGPLQAPAFRSQDNIEYRTKNTLSFAPRSEAKTS